MTHDLTTKAGVEIHMLESANKLDWNKRCDEVKAANDGQYPDFWFETIILSGLLDKTLGAGSSGITFMTEKPW